LETKSWAAEGDVLLPDDADLIDRVGENPQGEADERVGEYGEDVKCGREGEKAEDENDPVGAKPRTRPPLETCGGDN